MKCGLKRRRTMLVSVIQLDERFGRSSDPDRNMIKLSLYPRPDVSPCWLSYYYTVELCEQSCFTSADSRLKL
jgi:hypothetical protein